MKERWWTTVLILVVLLVTFTGSIVGLYTEFLWFNEIGQSQVFTKVLTTKVVSGFIFGIIFFIVVYGNILLARNLAPKYKVSYTQGLIKLKSPLIEKYLNWLLLLISFILSLFAGLVASSQWDIFLKFFNASSFGIDDPIFKIDIAFFIFKLPVYNLLWGFLFVAILLAAIISIGIHILDGAIQFKIGTQKFAPHVKLHISILSGLLFLLVAIGFRLLQYGLLYSSRGVVFGASYADINAQLPAYQILIVISGITAIMFFANTYFRGWTLPIIGVGILLGALVLAGGIYPSVIQSYKVKPNEITLEKPYIERNIKFTRMAYGLDKIQTESYEVSDVLTAADLEENDATIRNIRLWDWRPVLKTANQLQSMRLYYDFVDVDLDRYTFNNEYQQFNLAPRELSVEQLPETARTWLNQHLVYTHGYGLVMTPVNEVSGEGLPVLVVKDIPPISEEINIDRPEIYFGEKTSNYVVVNTKTPEFDYPKGEKNQYTNYKGTGGIRLGSLLGKVLFTMRFSSFSLVLADSITNDSRVMFHRDIKERVETIAPFLRYDQDPYIVVAEDGKGKTGLFWILDAYTATNKYPYSTPYDGGNYIRNSVKVVVDAYNGETTFYSIDDKDPVLKTYKNIFPDLFKPFKEMPIQLQEHIRYPEGLLKVQAHMYGTYHMLDPQVFYNKEDVWEEAKETATGGAQAMDPYYMIMKLPDGDKEEFLLIMPYTPSNKNNMIAWMAARNDSPNYGSLVVYQFSKDKLVFGPMQIEARINQNPTISQFLTLVSQRGSQVSKGPLLVIPVAGSLLYVQPLYIQAEQSELPELKRVFVSHGNEVAMDTSLEGALAQIFGAKEAEEVTDEEVEEEVAPSADEEDAQSLIDQAVEHFNKALEFQKEGDWNGYGRELNELEDILNQLQEKSGTDAEE